MKKRDTVALKTLAVFSVLAAASLGIGYKTIKDQTKKAWDTPQIDPEISKEQKMTLIGKSDAFFYFDTDGNKYTTEIVALKQGRACCPHQVRKMNDAKLDKTQSLKDWQKHLFCHHCGKQGQWKIQKVGKEIHILE